MADRENNRLKIVSVVIIITLIGKLMSLGRGMLIGQTFGTGWEADALMTASLLPRVFFDVIFASAVSASFIPVFNEVLQKKGREEAFGLSSSFFTVVGLAAALVMGLAMIFAPGLVAIMTDFHGEEAAETAALTIQLFRIILPTLFFTGIAFSMVGVLNSFGQFNIPAAMSIASNGIVIAYFLFFVERFGVQGAAVAFLLGWGAQALMQVPSLRKRGFSYRPRLWHPELKSIFLLTIPVMIGTFAQPINLLVSVRFASTIPGGIAGLEYANGLFIIIAGLFVLSVTNVIFPEMSRLSAAGDREKFREIVLSTIQTLLFLLVPMTVGLMLLATPVIQLIYERQQFDAHSTQLTAAALFFLSLGIVGYGVKNVLIRAFFAEKQGKIPLIAGAVSLAVNLTLCLLLVDRFGVGGLAFASAASLTAAAAVLAVAVHRRDKCLFTRGSLRDLLKMGLSSAIMGIGVFFLRDFIASMVGSGTLGRMILVFVPAGAGLAVYLFCASLFGLPQMNYLFQRIKRR